MTSTSRQISRAPTTPGSMSAVVHPVISNQESASPKTKELEQARDVVGLTRKNQLTWALSFAQQDVDELTPGDLLNDWIRLRAFLRPRENLLPTPMPWSMSVLPSPTSVVKIRENFADILKPSKVGEIRGGSMTLSCEVGTDREGRPAIEIKIPNPENEAVLRFAQLLEEYRTELRRCEDPKCRRWFIGRSNKQFCTTTCLSRVTTERAERLRKGGK